MDDTVLVILINNQPTLIYDKLSLFCQLVSLSFQLNLPTISAVHTSHFQNETDKVQGPSIWHIIGFYLNTSSLCQI